MSDINDAWILKIIAAFLYDSRPVKVLTKIVLLVHTSSLVLHMYYFVFGHDPINLIAKYYPIFSFTLFGDMNILTLILTDNVFMKTGDWVNFPKDRAGKKVEDEIRQECRRINALALMILFMILVTGFLHFYHTRTDDEVYLMVFVLNRTNIFGFEKYLKFVYKLSIIPFFYSMIVVPLQAIYYLQHARFQFQILTAEFKQLDFIKANSSDVDLVQNANYQTKVFERFTICMDKHQTLLRFLERKNSLSNVYVVPISITGCLHGIGATLYIINGIRLGIFTRTLIKGSLFVSGFWSLVTVAQLQKESCETLCEAVHQLKWYNWNSKNMKVYLISIGSFTNPYTLNFKGISVDYVLGVNIIKAIYQTVSVFVQIKLRS